MAESPLISVLMTAYNSGKYIADAIESVLASTLTDFELIIVDDCSKDNTVEIAKSYEQKDGRVKVFINEKNLGDYPNRNQAASYAKGKYIKYLDSDDVLYPHGLDVMARAMEQFPEAGFGLCSIPDQYVPYPVVISPKNIYLENFGRYGHFGRAPGSSIIKLDAFNKVGGFSGERMIGDSDLWFKMAMYYPMVKISTFIYWDRQHEGQERQSQYAKQEYPRLQKMIFDRYMFHQDCPLPEDEKSRIIKNRNTPRLRSVIYKFLKKYI